MRQRWRFLLAVGFSVLMLIFWNQSVYEMQSYCAMPPRNAVLKTQITTIVAALGILGVWLWFLHGKQSSKFPSEAKVSS